MTLALLLLLAAGQAPGPERLGYDDTPLLPTGDWRIHDGERPQPRVVTPPADFSPVTPPSDAVVLLGPGSDLSAWEMADGTPATWEMTDGVVWTGRGFIRTREEFSDFQLHVEFATPADVEGTGQGRGNSGVFLLDQFEIQVLDSYRNPTYPDGQAAAMYGQHPPQVNASRPPGEWQTYDIVFTAPRFAENGDLDEPARVTVLHNGVLVHHAATFWGPTQHRRIDPYVPENARGPISLQDHGNPVRYRNIWLRPIVRSGR
jgi:hypothetical protein